jgi:formate-dependent nitrite reductase membrane component NrfD
VAPRSRACPLDGRRLGLRRDVDADAQDHAAVRPPFAQLCGHRPELVGRERDRVPDAIAGYTGVLLAVSNQPIWSDSWALGGLFLASGLSGAAALLLVLAHFRRGAESSRGVLELSERLFTVLELLLLVVVLLTLIDDGTLRKALSFPWLLLWLVALIGMLPGLGDLAVRRFRATPDGAVVVGRVPAWLLAPTLVLVGVLALRAWVIFTAQH